MLQSQRFAGLPTLQACLAGSHVMRPDDPDAVAVRRVQEALADLGYLSAEEADGIFGERTSRAVERYKTDERLSPADAAVGRGTMGALDAAFAWEPVDGDVPDPTTDDLLPYAQAAVDNARAWATASRDALQAWPAADPNPTDPAQRDYEQAMADVWRMGSDAVLRERAVNLALLPMAEGVRALLASAVRLRTDDRAAFLDHSASYEPVDTLPGVVLSVAPPFRNVWNDEQRAGEVYRQVAHIAYPVAAVRGWPGTARWAGLDTSAQLRNSVAYAAFAYQCMTGQPASFLRPEPVWYP